MSNVAEQLQRTNIGWQKTNESAYLFKALFNGKEVRLRLNDFPDEPLGTLFVDAHEVQIEDFPRCWTLPRHRGE